MKVTKTVQGGVVNPTKVKKQLLDQEYENLQDYLHNREHGNVYSANKQQADRYYDEIKEGNEYPISIRRDLIDIQECDSGVCDYFINVPVAGRRGGVNLPVKTHEEIEGEICESKLYRENGNYYLNITVEKEVKAKDEYDGILGIDLGLRNPVTGVVLSVAESSPKVLFRGDKIKRTQTWYSYLRRNSETGKSWSSREHNKVRDELHKVTTELAEYAEKNDLIVVVGDLEGIQDQDKGRSMNRQLHRFPHYTFRQMLEYKCEERGIHYDEVDEAYTSQRCCKCGEIGERDGGIFECSGTEINSDVNGGWNIGKRALGKPEIRSLLGAGASVTTPEPPSDDSTSALVS